VLAQEGLPDRLARRPVEEYECDDELRYEQQIGQQPVIEDDRLFHSMPRHCERSEAIHGGGMAGSMDCFVAYAPRNDAPRCPLYFAVFSNVRNIALPLATASSSACCAVFCPARAASICSDQTSRICTMLPKRRPREFSVGSLLVSSFSGVCGTGFFS